jgi:hypothetical protein
MCQPAEDRIRHGGDNRRDADPARRDGPRYVLAAQYSLRLEHIANREELAEMLRRLMAFIPA